MHKKGFIQIIIIIVLLVVILSLLGVSLSSLFSNPILKDNFGFLGNGLGNFWQNYLSAPFKYIWNVWANLLWQPFVDVLTGIKNGIGPFDNYNKPK